MIYKILMPNAETLASHNAWMMLHPGFNAGYQGGDLIELEEGIFVLNDDLVPWYLATDEQIDEAITLQTNHDEARYSDND